eukprot:CAMPEP_0118936398 /NCGR_PEP_ID=MMETSP1169-20130426/18732_1 /TAXON_ID=36882 /ORGANISM="Pyramimonas obovata, Strain CCMP722" /LENGTH=425 /DNA_ID=CAMNT_0006879645 /DNA_START=77 /DNA_END=1354 /DNA_ORIENTATION=+
MAAVSGQRVAVGPRGPVRARAAQLRVQCAAEKDQQAKKAVLGLGAFAGSALSHPKVTFAVTELSKPLQTIVDAVDSASSLIEKTGTVASDVYKVAGEAATTAAPYVDRAGKALAPVGETAGKLIEKNVAPLASDLASKGSQAATSAIAGAVTGVDAALKEQGVPISVEATVKSVAKGAPKAADAAKPVVQGAFEFLSTTEPTVLAEYAAVLYLVYLSRGIIAGFIGKTIRGYSGDLTPPQALNMLMENKSAVLVDLRTPDEVAAKGLLDLNKKQAKQVVVCERTTLPGGQFENINKAEIEVTTVKVASLKIVKKGKSVILLDQSGKQAKSIAKELTSKGYGKVYTVEGGFLSWMNAQLKTKASFNAKADALFVSRPSFTPSPAPRREAAVDVVVNNPTPRRAPNKLGTVSGRVINASAKSLPPGK